jgi:hypothetical protein
MTNDNIPRGAIRVHTGAFDPAEYLDELAAMEREWRDLGHGAGWSAIVLEKNGKSMLPGYGPDSKTYKLARMLGSDIRRVAVARLAAGGWIKEHRDINGAALTGMLRFHFPLVTSDEVVFEVDRVPLRLAAGEVWYLDTSYRHAVRNESNRDRVHLIVDFDNRSEAARLLPAKGFMDYVHQVAYLGACAGKMLSLVASPREMGLRARQAYRAFVKRETATT